MSTVVEDHDKRTAENPEPLTELVEMTQSMFGRPVTVESMCDPETPSEKWTVFTVEASGEAKELIQRQCEWHSRLAKRFPDLVSHVRLSICPKV